MEQAENLSFGSLNEATIKKKKDENMLMPLMADRYMLCGLDVGNV